MSISGSSDEFAYQTRLVVYNFLGLVPAAPSQSDDEGEGSQSAQEPQDTKPPSPWNDALGTLPTVSLIDRLSESEAQQMKMRMVCDEVEDRVKRVEPVSSEQPSKETNQELSNNLKHRNYKHHEKLDLEKAHEAVLNELKQKVPDRGRSPNDFNNDEMASGTITVIQKRNRVKILGDSITSVEEADIRRRLSLQPFSSAVKSSEVSFGRASVQLPHSALPGTGFSFGGRTSGARRPTTLLSSSTPSAEMAQLASSREKLCQIDEEHESDGTNGCTLDGDGQADGASSRDAPMSASGASARNFTPRPSSVHTPISIERQSSGRSGSSRRCSTYIDITEVDVESLVRSKTLPSVTVPLKRELSIAFEELEKNHQTGDDTGGFGPNATVDDLARTPESEVADSLRALGDRIQEEYGYRLNSIVQDILGSTSSPVNYSTVQNLTSQLLQQTQQGWTRVALVMLLGQHLVYELLRQGYTGISQMAEYTAKLLEDNAADFIINNGGWNSISDIGVTETETSLNSSDIDFRMIPPEFNCSSGDSVESYLGGTSAAPVEATPLRNSGASESFQETFLPDAQEQVDSIDWAKGASELSSVEPSTDVCSSSADLSLQEQASLPGMTVSTPSDTSQPPDQSIEGDIVLLRQNSQQYMDEMESARRTVALTQSGAFVGLALLTLLASWLLYQRFRRVT